MLSICSENHIWFQRCIITQNNTMTFLAADYRMSLNWLCFLVSCKDLLMSFLHCIMGFLTNTKLVIIKCSKGIIVLFFLLFPKWASDCVWGLEWLWFCLKLNNFNKVTDKKRHSHIFDRFLKRQQMICHVQVNLHLNLASLYASVLTFEMYYLEIKFHKQFLINLMLFYLRQPGDTLTEGKKVISYQNSLQRSSLFE